VTVEITGTLAGEIALAIAAGVALNATPCVLPAIPVKIRTILRESGGEPTHRFLAALAYTAGALAFFLTIGGLTAWLQWTWGAVFQSKGTVSALVAVLVLAAAFTFRDVAVPVPAFAVRLRGHRYVEPALSGALSAVLAAPCAGPFLGGVLAYALTRSPVVILATFAAIGIGLSLPYVVLLLRPSLLGHLPRGGRWSVRVREGLSFVLLAAAVFFAQSLVPAAWEPALWVAWVMLLVVWAGRALYLGPGHGSRLVAGTFLALGIGLTSVMTKPFAGVAPAIGWLPYSDARLAAARNENEPVVVEFTADWCINCKVLEKTVYSDADVASTIERTGTSALRIDLTQSHPRMEKVLTRYGGAALPYAVVLDSRGRVVQRFPGLFSANELVGAVRLAHSRSTGGS